MIETKLQECGECGHVGESACSGHDAQPMTDAEWAKVGTPVVERAKAEILKDIAKGVVPDSVASFSELHDYVDANWYGGAFEGEFDASDECLYFWNRVQGEVDEWLKERAGKKGE